MARTDATMKLLLLCLCYYLVMKISTIAKHGTWYSKLIGSAWALVLVVTLPAPHAVSALEIEQSKQISLGNFRPSSINNRQQVAGELTTKEGYGHAGIWEAGSNKDLGALPGAYHSKALNINDAGTVAGYSDKAIVSEEYPNYYPMRAVYWKSGVIKEIPTLNAKNFQSSQAVAINNKGDIVGWSEVPSGGRRAFKYSNGLVTKLDELPGSISSVALDVNDAGVIVGVDYAVGGRERAVMWVNNKVIDVSGYVGAKNASVSAINNKGQLLIYSRDYEKTYVVTGDAVTLLLPLNLNDLPNISNQRIAGGGAMNEHGDVVGTSVPANYSYDAGFQLHPTIWSGNDLKPVDLVSEVGGRGSATDINDKGDIVGSFRGTSYIWINN